MSASRATSRRSGGENLPLADSLTLAEAQLSVEPRASEVKMLKKFKHVLDVKLAEVTESMQPKATSQRSRKWVPQVYRY